MGTWIALATVLAAGAGEVTQANELQASREATRFHAAVGLVGTVGVGGYLGGGGPGVTAELGFTVADRSTFAVRASLGTVLVTTATSLGLSWDLALSDRWSLGTGAMLGYMGGFLATDLPSALVAQVPFRAQFAFSERRADQRSRGGLRLFVEAGPGVVLAGNRGLVRGAAASVPIERWAVMGALGLSWVF